LRRIDGLTQHRIDARLAEILLAHSVGDRPFRTSHELLAAEVGTAREVISRHLALFERQGAIARRRGSIAVRDRNTLEALVRRRT
jgi:CRP/FNR family transcriptional regulator